MNVLGLSTLGIWDITKGKGRVSTYLPLKGFVDRGHQVTYITSRISETSHIEDGIEVKRIYLPLSKMRTPLAELLQYPLTLCTFLYRGILQARKGRPDVIYSHTTITALPAYLLAKILKAKYVLRLYGVGDGLHRKKIAPSFIFLYTAFLLKADIYLLTNDGTHADEVALSFGVLPEKIHFLKNGIEKSKVVVQPNEVIRTKHAPHGEYILLSVCRLETSKGVDLIIKALPALLQLTEHVKLLIVGDGDEKERLQSLAARLNIVEQVVFTGAIPQSQVAEYVAISDAFISMNELSSLSNPVFEAMLGGRVVIARDRGATKSLITNNENGFVIADEHLDELPDLIYRILSDEILRKRIERNAQNYIMRAFQTWEERVKQEVDIVEKLCNQTKSTGE
jgi:glycosyltransferase involved in cell wall biosynthesis